MNDDHDLPDDGDSMIDEVLDCTGKKRRFRLHSYAGGMFLDAVEILDGEACGMRFVMKMDEHGHVPWGPMREKIRARMAERDLAVDPDSGRLEILRGRVRATITSTPERHEADEDGPQLIVDDRRITWRELGSLLSGLEGWGLQLTILDALQD